MTNDSVLIVVDMLYDFIDGSLACANAENAVENTLDFIKKPCRYFSSGTIILQTTALSRSLEASGLHIAWPEPAAARFTKSSALTLTRT